MSAERPTFSPFWHRVRAMKPRLRPHVQSTRQFYRGQRWHVVHDPSSNQYYRLNPVAYEFVALLDGKRTVEECWTLVLQNHGDSAPTQHEAITLISQMYSSNLLAVDDSPEVDQLLRRGTERRSKMIKQQAIGLMYFKLRLFNPNHILEWIEPIMRPVLNRWGLIAWIGLIVAALIALIPHWSELKNGVDDTIASANWGWLAVVFVVTKLWHETGHGVLCKRFGGNVPEFGVMMLVLFPSPFVDASACWAFQSKWQRMAVGAGGMLFELALAAVAAFVWLSVPDGLLKQIAYNAMFTCSVSTILFNANPLMRFDGYYILSDLLEMPNLMQRSTQMLKYWAHKFIYRLKDINPPATDRDELAILTVFGIASTAYRVFLFFSITLYVLGKMFAIGLFLAVWSAAAWFILPTGTFIHWLATSPKLADHRWRAVGVSMALIVAAVLLIGVIPMPDRRRGEGVIDSSTKSGVFSSVDAFVKEVHKRPGEFVAKGEPIVTMESSQLEAQIRLIDGYLAEATAVEREATAGNPAAAQVARQRVATLQEQKRFFLEKQDKLVVRAPHSGVITGADPQSQLGAFLKEGKPICDLIDVSKLRVTALMDQTEALWLYEQPREAYDVEMRLVSNVGEVVEGGAVRVIEAGTRRLAHNSLTFAGGGSIEVERLEQQSGVMAKRPQFQVEIDPKRIAENAQEVWAGLPGERVRLRFALPPRPLLAQWVDRLQKLVQGRVNL
ncbi:MAG: PqqD family peptide modification chaperone [Planctomycetes bacterium]|nr:PqqD family peptide modification chaperone [Planctomycetota bacterium]